MIYKTRSDIDKITKIPKLFHIHIMIFSLKISNILRIKSDKM